jgi:selT/selW/selH-like putative selenoprotein
MWTIKYCRIWNYRPHAESLSAEINSKYYETCEIEEGGKGQFDIFKSGELILSKKHDEDFFTIESVIKKLEETNSSLYAE